MPYNQRDTKGHEDTGLQVIPWHYLGPEQPILEGRRGANVIKVPRIRSKDGQKGYFGQNWHFGQTGSLKNTT